MRNARAESRPGGRVGAESMMHAREPFDDPWQPYWQADRLDSCVAATGSADARELATFWARFAARLPAGSTVLDLATGNGAVPHLLLGENPALIITAIDRSDIDPPVYVKSSSVLDRVNFRGGVDLCELPFENDSFDAITSQFGVEYAPLDEAAASIGRVLKPGGTAAFLLHHVDSEVVRSAQPVLDELAGLLAADGLIDGLSRYLRGEIGTGPIRAAADRHLEADCRKTRRVSGRIFDGVTRIVRIAEKGGRGEAARASADMIGRLRAEQARLRQLHSAALDEAGLDDFRRRLLDAGVAVETAGPLLVGGDTALVGWSLTARKRG